ncbi:MAG TPA: L,D-transpeptidase family protein [Bradyrhizobium sp.]|jgi:L,D-peptidoglycan transpeptidase YkuD (ErfK/YbiS/YcfS/YnhG family)
MKKQAKSKDYLHRARNRPLSMIRIRARAGNSRQGWLTAPGLTIPVALGRGGILANKREGDGGTPRGIFHPRKFWWRADRFRRPRSFLSARAITANDAWCEDPHHRHYNKPIHLARDHKGDRLQRADHLYDFIVEIDHNIRPRVAGRGSAVFLHLARANFAPTAGCVSMARSAMLHLLRRLGPRTRIIIG